MADQSIYSQLLPTDEDELTEDIKDHVALTLNEDWKKFAYNILTDEEIERINADQNRVFEKCYAVLKLWNQKSECGVNKAMLKLKLNELGRRDILHDLAQSFDGFGAIVFNDDVQRPRPRPVNVELKNVTAKKEMTVTDLKMRHVDRLEAKLDMSFGSSISNWKHLAHELIGEDPLLQDSLRDLELHYYGGGNPALEFLRKLSVTNPQVTVGDFRAKAHSFHRNDIVHCLNELLPGRDGDKLRDLDMRHKERLATLMNLMIPGVYGWEMFADEYGYKYTQINQIKTSIRDGNSYSPTKKLFELLKEVRPHLPLTDIQVKCVKLGRNDVSQLFDEFMKES